MQMGAPVDGSVPKLTHAVAVQFPVPHTPPLQLSSWTGVPAGCPGCAVHGVGPASMAVPVGARRRVSSGAAGGGGPGSGGQGRGGVENLLVPGDAGRKNVASVDDV